jgi:hypothetical protein
MLDVTRNTELHFVGSEARRIAVNFVKLPDLLRKSVLAGAITPWLT